MATGKSNVRKWARSFVFLPSVKFWLSKIPGLRAIYAPIWGVHPIDRELGIDTSGLVGTGEIHQDKGLTTLINPYIGSQPSIVRKGLAALGDCAEYTFVDFGGGKGRAVVVASEFPFRNIMGIELSPSLAGTARSNASRIALQFPDRSTVTIANANVSDFVLPPGRLACFNYHAFGLELLSEVVQKFEALLRGNTPHMFFVYYNPVHFEVLDNSSAFQRFYAQQLQYDESEIGFGPDVDDGVVSWQSVKGAVPIKHRGDDRKIVLNASGERARVVD